MNRAVISGMLHHLLCGWVAFLPFLRSDPASAAQSPLTPAIILSGPFLLGAGLGTIVQANVGRRQGLLWAVRLSLFCLALAAVLQSGGNFDSWNNGLADPRFAIERLLAGIGICGLWTPAAERTRQSLSTIQRWMGMRVWSLMPFVGGLLALLITQGLTAGDGAVFWPAVAPALACAVLMLWTPTQSGSQANTQHQSSHDTGSNHPITPTDSVSSDNDCGADECCGGNREWLPVPLSIGAGLVAVGAFALWVMFVDTLVAQDAVGRIVLIAGAMLGMWLFQSTLPDTGYAILLLLFSLLALVGWLGIAAFDDVRNWRIVLLLLGGTLGATSYGCFGLACESFEASCHRTSQAVVFLVGHMAAAALLAVFAFRMALIPSSAGDAWRAIVFFAAICLVRRIPGPVVSSRGRDESLDEEDAEEAKSVLADAMTLTKDGTS